MCGFAGFVLNSDRPFVESLSRREAVQAMGQAIAHRGPDEVAYFHDGPLSLVFRRLSILDVAGGRQPIKSESGRHVAVVNGEIYNHAELRARLSDRHRFSSRSDSEAAVHAWEEWGSGSFSRLTGMFSMLVWDRVDRTLTLARDRLGIKPLYVCPIPGGILFGSELKALLAHPRCPREPDWDAIRLSEVDPAFVTAYLRGIEQVPGGESLTLHADGRLDRRSWWSLADHIGSAPLGHAAGPYIEGYANLLEQVTREHLQRDVGAGLMLSGGLDSSLLAAIVARVDRDLPCFSIVDHGSVVSGDIDAACRLTGQLGLRWHPVCFDHRNIVARLQFDLDSFEQAVWMMDSPRFDLEWIFKGEVHRVAKAMYPGLKVMLIGQGADEFAGGYSHRMDAPYADWADYIRDEVNPLVGPSGDRTPFQRLMLRHLGQLRQFNLWHEDRSSSRHGIEARIPYLDHRLVELLAGVPASLHEALFWNKRIIRAALERLTPGIRITQPKLGFLCTPDLASMELVMRDVILAVYPAFRERHAGSAVPAFNRRQLDLDFERVRRFSPGFGQVAHGLAQAMALSVFARQCAGHPPVGAQPGPLPGLLDRKDWPARRAGYVTVPKASVPWRSGSLVTLRDGVKIDVITANPGRTTFVLSLGEERLGALKLPDTRCLESRFLLQLAATPLPHPVGHWLQTLGADEAEFTGLLDVLLLRGALEFPDDDPAAETLKAA